MKRLTELLGPEERAELGRVLPVGTEKRQSQDLAARVREVVDQDLVISDEAASRWAGQEVSRRSRMMSEMVWRITCVFDASTTAVVGLSKFNLGWGFELAMTQQDGRRAFVVQC